MGKKGTRAKPKQTKKDAVVAAKAQPAQLMTDLRKELNVGDEQYSPTYQGG